MNRILIFALSVFSVAAFAQLELKKLDGTPINNGDVFTFTTLTEPGAYLGLKIYNTSDEDISIKARIVNIVNSTGNNLQLCVGGVCLSTITTGATYPNFPAIIPANGENGNFDHFVNYNPGINQTQVVEYTIKILMVNDQNQEIGNSVQFTYRYASPLATDSFALEKLGISLPSTLVTDQLMLTAESDFNMELFDVSGKSILTQKGTTGTVSIELGALPAAVYIARFTTSNGQTASVRLLKK
jgi:hypothetical protein